MTNNAIDILQRFANDKALPTDQRIAAAKALLPYTSKKLAETLELISSTTITTARLKDFSDDELRTLHGFIKRLTPDKPSGGGDEEAEVQLHGEVLPGDGEAFEA